MGLLRHRACRLLAPFLEAAGKRSVVITTDPDNIPSMHLLKKLGYRDMGYLRNKDSQVFGMHTTEETDEELARVTER